MEIRAKIWMKIQTKIRMKIRTKIRISAAKLGGDVHSSHWPGDWKLDRQNFFLRIQHHRNILNVNRFSQKIIRTFSENFRKIRKSKFSETAFLTKSARNGVRNLARNANSDPMVKISSKSDKWRRKIRISAKIRKIPKFPYYNLRNSINVLNISRKIYFVARLSL